MTKTLTFAALLALSMDHGHCQSMSKAPAFEAASVNPCKPGTPAPPGEHAGMAQFVYPGGRFEAKATTIKFLLEWAYGILPIQHSDGPSWMDDDRYDIFAKADGNPPEHEMKLMVQTLLAERFHLKFHRESKDLPVLVISVGKTAPKLFPAKEGETHSLQASPLTGADQKAVSFHIVATRFTLAQFSEAFARQLGRVIVDETGLKGNYDFTMDLTPDENRPNPLDASLLIAGLRDQLGLALKSQKGPVDFLVIENVDRVAAEN
jgi:uncharacterized protein (TIGR03435 family)